MFLAQPVTSVMAWGFTPLVLAAASSLYQMLARGVFTPGGLAITVFAGILVGLIAASGLWIGLCFSHQVPKTGYATIFSIGSLIGAGGLSRLQLLQGFELPVMLIAVFLVSALLGFRWPTAWAIDSQKSQGGSE